MSTSFLVSLQNLVPRSFSPRTGILASHLVFSVVWVILASVQEVHENLSSSSSSSYDGVWNDSVQTNNNNVMGEHLSSASPSSQPQHQQSYTQKYPQSQALGDSNRSAVAGGEGSMMAVSLCVVWYVAVMLLGVATALLATSSTVLDSQMEQQIQEVVAQEEQKEDSDDITVVLVNNNNDEKSTTAAAAAQSVKYPLVQKVTLAMMILVLFYSQMWFFEWILSALSSLTSLSSSGIAVSTRLGLFGLFSTLIMLTLGMRFIPPTKARQ
ncbi:hypothetical protein BGX33_008766 [Mortierella sp. NVP41]|nr:hypothetical protein BGX33_008766 [Mortierella sp. NVP41]